MRSLEQTLANHLNVAQPLTVDLRHAALPTTATRRMTRLQICRVPALHCSILSGDDWDA